MESQPGFKAWLEHCHLNHLKNGHRLKCCFREFVKRNDNTLPGREVVGAASSQVRAPRPLLGNLHSRAGGCRGQGDHGEGGPGSRQHRGTGGAPGEPGRIWVALCLASSRLCPCDPEDRAGQDRATGYQASTQARCQARRALADQAPHPPEAPRQVLPTLHSSRTSPRPRG